MTFAAVWVHYLYLYRTSVDRGVRPEHSVPRRSMCKMWMIQLLSSLKFFIYNMVILIRFSFILVSLSPPLVFLYTSPLSSFHLPTSKTTSPGCTFLHPDVWECFWKRKRLIASLECLLHPAVFWQYLIKSGPGDRVLSDANGKQRRN